MKAPAEDSPLANVTGTAKPRITCESSATFQPPRTPGESVNRRTRSTSPSALSAAANVPTDSSIRLNIGRTR